MLPLKNKESIVQGYIWKIELPDKEEKLSGTVAALRANLRT